MASQCNICGKPKKPRQPTAQKVIHDTTYTVHAACKDLMELGAKPASLKWNFKTMKLK
jgi:hypothetical protein